MSATGPSFRSIRGPSEGGRLRTINLRGLWATQPATAQLGFVANAPEWGGVDVDGDTSRLRPDEWMLGLARLGLRNPALLASSQSSIREIQTFFDTGLRPGGPADGRALLVKALNALASTPRGRLLIERFQGLSGETEAVTDEAFKRTFGTEFAAAGCTETEDGRPHLLVANVFGDDPKGIASVLAHEMTHGLVQKIVESMRQAGPTPEDAAADALLWNETLAATVQARVEAELGLTPCNLAANPDGSLRTPEETAQAIRNDPTYAECLAGAGSPGLRWPFSVAGPQLHGLL